MTRELTVQLEVDFGSGRRTGKKMTAGESDTELPRRIPRVAKLMALAIRFERLLREGVIADQVELARLGHVSRARVTQIMNLLNLAPGI